MIFLIYVKTLNNEFDLGNLIKFQKIRRKKKNLDTKKKKYIVTC